MILIFSFGVLLMAFSVMMIKSPQAFANSIIKFSQQSYFHRFEILSRVFYGLGFVYYSSMSKAAYINAALGYLMLFTATFVLLIGAEKHRAFAVWSAQKFRAVFRFAGVFSFVFAGFIIYTSI